MNTTSGKTSRPILIKKASGEEEQFSSDKLRRSLLNAGASESTVLKIVNDIEAWIYPGVTTKNIYTRAFSILRRAKTSLSIKYKLKRAIYELGPTGYPFEQLIGQLFERQGYTSEVGVIVEGHCVSHEMDVIATRERDQNLVECKYHKDQGKQVSIQVPLYVRSRVDDIISKRKTLEEFQGLAFSAWVVTNTRFSQDSIQYGKCCGLKLLAWDYPTGHGLKEIIEKLKVYPITILQNLNIREKRSLLESGIVTCYQISENPDSLKFLDLNSKKVHSLMEEIREICN